MFTEPQTASKAAEAQPLRKFMFERSFDGAPGAVRVERKPVTLKPEQYDALKQESFDRGMEAGRKAGFDEQTAKLAAILSQIDRKIEQMFANLQAMQAQSEDGMRRVACAMVRKLMPELAARHGLQEIEAMLRDTMAEMVHEPRLVVRIHESQFDAVNGKISDIGAQKAYNGKVVGLADAGIAPGDCLIEWADGGIARNSEAKLAELEKIAAPHGGAHDQPRQE